MKKWIVFLLFVIPVQLFSQGIELYGGYPYRFNTDKFNPTYVKGFKNGNNWEAGISGSFFIRPVLLQYSVGYLSHNFSFDYFPNPNYYYSIVKMDIYTGYWFMSLGVYPKVYADGKHAVSVGAGINLITPVNTKAYRTDNFGVRSPDVTGFSRFAVIMPRVAFRYSYWLGKGFYLHGSLYSDYTVMPIYDEANSNVTASYYHFKVTLGANTGVGYFIHRKKGIQKPVYFEPWKKREKKEGGKR